MEQYGFGVDIGGTSCKIGLFSLEGELIEKWEIRTSKENRGADILEHVAEAVTQKMDERGILAENVLGIGLDVPGPVAKNGVVSQCVNLGWENYPAAELLSARMNMKVRICNDANAAALGELWRGGGMGSTDMVMVTLGTGVGGAVIIDGKVLAGVHGIAGEIGHITICPEETSPCACGKYGCVEQYASATGLVRVARRFLEKRQAHTVLQDGPELSAKMILDAAKRGDAVALDAVEVLGRTLGNALAAVSGTVDPEVFVIGGGVSKAGEILLDITKKYYVPQVLPAAKGTKFALATLGNDAGMYGCMKMLLE